MIASPHASVRIDLGRLRANALEIRATTGVAVLAVVKADAYGHGAGPVVRALCESVDGFCVFSLAEAVDARIAATGKLSLALGPGQGADVNDYLAHAVRPSVWEAETARAMLRARPVLAVDTGMQRFACPAEQIDFVLKAGQCTEAFTHATNVEKVHRLVELVGGRGLTLHAAGSSLLGEPEARLDAVRPGLALYRGAARISISLVDTRRSHGPIGYTGFSADHHGVILAGYSHGLRPGPCLVNGRPSRLLEVGMQTSYVQTDSTDRVGDQVVLLGDGLTEFEIAKAWSAGPHEVLTRLCTAGIKTFVE